MYLFCTIDLRQFREWKYLKPIVQNGYTHVAFHNKCRKSEEAPKNVLISGPLREIEFAKLNVFAIG